MKRSRSATALLLTASLVAMSTLTACGGEDEDITSAQADGMAFSSVEECSINIGPENCRSEPKQQAVHHSDGSTTFIPIFMPMGGYGGGYLPGSPRYTSGAYSNSPAWGRTNSAISRGVSPTSAGTTSSSGVSRGGFGSSASSSVSS